MPSCSPHMCIKEERSVFSYVGIFLVGYFIIMDVMMYVTIQNTPSLINQKPPADGYSMFRPLTSKHLMSDFATLYFYNPLLYIFDKVTNFSEVFYFITPNMISFFHLGVALLAAKLVSSLNLSMRRLGALLFTFRTWLDGLDGYVYRSRIGQKLYFHTARFSTGYYVDCVCDSLGGVFLSFGILFYFYKILDSKATDLPYTKLENGNGQKANPKLTNGHTANSISQFSKFQLFWKMWCAGFMVAVAAGAWDYILDQMKVIFETELKDPTLQGIQSAYLHSFASWFVFILWRLCEGQSLLVYITWAIVIDKIWEYINLIQYIGYLIILSVFMISLFYVQHIKADLHL